MRKFLLGLGITYIAITPAIYWLLDSPRELAIFILISGVLLAVFSKFNEVTELSLFGLQAKIERVLTETHATLAQVKGLAKISAISSLSNTARSGWVGGMDEDQRREILRSTEDALKNLGFTKHDLDEIVADYHDCQLVEYKQVILGGGRSEIPDIKDPECQKEWKELRRRPISPPVHPDEMRAFFKKWGLLNKESERRLEGYAYYYHHKDFKDLEDYKNRESWPNLRKAS